MGHSLPSAIANAPELEEDNEWLYEAWIDLSTCRNGSGPIPWTAVKMYADELQYNDIQREALFHCLRHLDTAYLNHIHEEMDK